MRQFKGPAFGLDLAGGRGALPDAAPALPRRPAHARLRRRDGRHDGQRRDARGDDDRDGALRGRPAHAGRSRLSHRHARAGRGLACGPRALPANARPAHLRRRPHGHDAERRADRAPPAPAGDGLHDRRRLPPGARLLRLARPAARARARGMVDRGARDLRPRLRRRRPRPPPPLPLGAKGQRRHAREPAGVHDARRRTTTATAKLAAETVAACTRDRVLLAVRRLRRRPPDERPRAPLPSTCGSHARTTRSASTTTARRPTRSRAARAIRCASAGCASIPR